MAYTHTLDDKYNIELSQRLTTIRSPSSTGSGGSSSGAAASGATGPVLQELQLQDYQVLQQIDAQQAQLRHVRNQARLVKQMLSNCGSTAMLLAGPAAASGMSAGLTTTISATSSNTSASSSTGVANEVSGACTTSATTSTASITVTPGAASPADVLVSRLADLKMVTGSASTTGQSAQGTNGN
ncbi:unnamed protein product [Protopolystoma xenopodis]|uniref:Uncharacterized protein n=1 Tax=Protopolystoma xenopodis TaxID=117903 RepID=A0A448WD29_9PLAT|nr:unnamed protein product [Protopolystoma xenopodis]